MSEPSKIGYHLRPITKGRNGEVSKLREELEELADAETQHARIMMLVELSDLVGAIKLMLANQFPGFCLRDLEIMADITARAFQSGART